MAKPVKVTDPNKKGGAGFLWGIVALLVIVALTTSLQVNRKGLL